MRQILLGVLAAACACGHPPHYVAQPQLPLDGDRDAREYAYDQYHLTVDGDRVRRADGSYSMLETSAMLDASPRAHRLYYRNMNLGVGCLVAGLVSDVVLVTTIGSGIDDTGNMHPLSIDAKIVGASALVVLVGSLVVGHLASHPPSAAELVAAYNADLRERLALDHRE